MIKIKNLFVPPEYVSPIDKLLIKLRKQFPQLSLSQKKERAKFARIFFLRSTSSRNSGDKKPRDPECIDFLNK